MAGTSEDHPSTEMTTSSEDSLVPSTTDAASDDYVIGLAVPSDIDVQPRELAEGGVCIASTCEASRARMPHRPNMIDDATSKKRSFLELPEVASSSASSTMGESSVVVASTATLASLSKKSRTETELDDAARLKRMEEACKTILECVGENPDREGLVKTPSRWAKALLFMTKGYGQTCEEVTNGAVFEEDHDEMVVVRNIDIHSLCEHHMVPFTGRVHIGYIPNGKVLGLSKLARIAEVYARRLQVQERLTRQIADAIVDAVEPLGVAVVVECSHMCMVMRGVQKVGASTTTSSVRGIFESNSKTRAEFFSIIHGSSIRMC
jgi:GTP cyclohydrolase I